MSNSKSAGIYSITSKINGKRYIGSALRICDRWKSHLNDLRNNRHHSQYLQNHFNKYSENDLVFSVLEVIDKGELSLQDFKQLLLDTEQIYLNNWEECHFNCLPTAGSNLGYKNPKAKYYYFDKKTQMYITYFDVDYTRVNFSCHYVLEEAIKEVEYIKSLVGKELLRYKQECLAKPTRRPRNAKNYSFNKVLGKYKVYFKINGKPKHFGYFKTEEEAKQKVEEIKKELGGFE